MKNITIPAAAGPATVARLPPSRRGCQAYLKRMKGHRAEVPVPAIVHKKNRQAESTQTANLTQPSPLYQVR